MAGPAAAGAGKTSDAPPVEDYVIPFDKNPKSSPGEKLIFGATYKHATPNQFKLVYTAQGIDYGSAGSGVKTKTFPGLDEDNIYWYIDKSWDGKTAVTMKLEVQKTDGTVVKTTNWTFSKKAYHPTTIKQKEGEGERSNPASYTYELGPDRGGDGKDDYVGWTILEEFGTRTSNLKVADIKPAYRTTHGLTSDQKITDHFFGTSSSNGTFTVYAGDEFYDQHGGMYVSAAEAKDELVTPKQVEVYLPQVYSSEPGKPLGEYTVTRIQKTGGAKKIKKAKKP